MGAHALATTGRDLRGNRFPLFVSLSDPLGGEPEPWGETYYHPFLFYFNALVMTVVPPSIAAARLPMAIVGGVISPLLFYLMARRVIGQPLPALMGALVLALAPVHVILSRQAIDYVLPVPFVIGWLWLLERSLRTREPRAAALAGLVLGIGCYSYIASWVVMPMLLALSWVLWLRGGLGGRAIGVSVLAFLVPVLVAPLWIVFHPEMARDTWARYTGPPDAPPTPLVPTFMSLITPRLWFVRGGPSLITATARSGVVLLPVALWMLAGGVKLARLRDWRAAVVVAGVLIGLLPAAAKGEPGMVQRAMYVLPFVALAAGFGVAWLLQVRFGRAVVGLVLVGSVAQFGYFYFDFLTHYKFRSAFYYDPAAFRDVTAHLVAAPEAPAYYFTDDMLHASAKWRFYTTVERRASWLAKTRYIAADERPDAPPGSVLVTYDARARVTALLAGGWRVEAVITDVDKRPAAVILRKLP